MRTAETDYVTPSINLSSAGVVGRVITAVPITIAGPASVAGIQWLMIGPFAWGD